MQIARSTSPARPIAPNALPPLRGGIILPRFRLPQTTGGMALHLFGLIVAAAVLIPVGYLVFRAASGGEAAIRYLFSGRVMAIIGNTVVLVGAVVGAATVLAVLFAWLTTRTDVPFRRAWLILGLLPLVIPSYIGAMTFAAAFGAKGYLQQMLLPLGVERLPSIYGFFGAWLVITLFTYPYVALPLRAALLNTDPALEESGRSMGLSAFATFRRGTFPQLRPALGVGMILAALYTLSDFGAVAIMQYDSFTRVIFVQYTSSFNRGIAATLSLVLVVFAFGLIFLERRIASQKKNYRAGVGACRKHRVVALRGWKVPALLFCGGLVCLGVGVPGMVLAAWLAEGAAAGVTLPLLDGALLNTVTVSGAAALVVGVVALPMALLAVRSNGRWGRWIVQITFLGHGLPGLVIALALVFVAANALPALYQTLPILIFGYGVRFLPLSIGATRSALTQINPRLGDASRSLGLSAWQTTRRVTLPLMRAGVLGGMALVFLNTMKELPTTLMLSPTGFRTLTTHLWTAQTNGDWALAAAPALVIVAVSALSLVFILRDGAGNH